MIHARRRPWGPATAGSPSGCGARQVLGLGCAGDVGAYVRQDLAGLGILPLVVSAVGAGYQQYSARKAAGKAKARTEEAVRATEVSQIQEIADQVVADLAAARGTDYLRSGARAREEFLATMDRLMSEGEASFLRGTWVRGRPRAADGTHPYLSFEAAVARLCGWKYVKKDGVLVREATAGGRKLARGTWAWDFGCLPARIGPRGMESSQALEVEPGPLRLRAQTARRRLRAAGPLLAAGAAAVGIAALVRR